MKSLSIWSAIFVCLVICSACAYASAAECPLNLPAGVVIRVVPDEKLMAGISSGPTILTVTSDVRFFPNRPPLIARGSKILGTIVESKEAGRLHGKARVRLDLTSILTSDFCEYPIAAKVIEAGRHRIENDVVWGRGHTQRDTLALLFPPTTIYQLVRVPNRGPKLVLDYETPLTIKLLEPVSVAEDNRRGTLRSEADPIESDPSGARTPFVPHAPQLTDQHAARAASGSCSAMGFSSARPLVQNTTILRPVRNLTPYHVMLYLDHRLVGVMPPCYGPSLIATPVTEFKLEAAGSLSTAAGNKYIAVKIVPADGEAGWDIVPVTDEPVALRAN
jgi:hypothetical protein